MRHSSLCGGDIRLEFFPDKGRTCASVSVDGDLEERPAAHCDAGNLRAVLHGIRYHLAGPGWLCSITRNAEVVELDLWREGQPAKKCRVPVKEYEEAIDMAFGAAVKAYAA